MVKDDRFRVFLECIESPVLVINKKLVIVYCNAAYASLLGVTAEELAGCKLLDALPDLTGSPTHKAYMQVLSSGSGAQTETTVANRCFMERIYPTPQGLISVADDISDVKRFESVIAALAQDYHDVFDEIWDAVIIQDTYTTDILEANKSACNMFEYTREELIAKNMGELCADEAPFTSEEFKRWLRMAPRDMPQSMEWKALDSNGHEFWIDVRCRRLVLNEEIRLVAVIRDITTVKTANDELRSARKEYEGFFKNASDFIFITDLGGNFISVNPAAERITGYLTGELKRMNIQELADEDTLQLLRGFQYQRLANGRYVSYEAGFISKNGKQLYLDMSIWPIYKGGKPVAVQGIGRNITRMKEEIIRLKKAEQSLKGLVQYLPDATLAINMEGIVVAWNEAMEELTGIKAEEMLGKDNYEYSLAFYGDRRPIMVDLVLQPEEVQQYYQVVEVDRYTVISEFPTPNLRGQGRYLWGRAMPWYDEDGKMLGAIECLRDITDRYNYLQTLKDDMKALEDEYADALDSMAIPLLLADRTGRIIYASQSLHKLLGYKGKEMVGRALESLLAEKDQAAAQEFVQVEQPASFEVSLVRSKGTLVNVNLEVKPQKSGIMLTAKKRSRPKKA